MNYSETLNFLFTSLQMFQRVGASAYKANLDNTTLLDQYFSHPHTKFRTIHVAGTNGKGSVSHSLAAVLQSAGYKVGLYTSPHLYDFRERIKINGEMIPESEVVDFVEKHRKIIDDITPSFFEMSVAMAFDYFARNEVEIAVIEVGMGGRIDSTNIITPLLSIITNISYDHTQFLGDTLSKIAVEKAGIIKPGVPVVIGESLPETSEVFESTANRCGSPLFFADKLYTCDNARLVSKNSQLLNLKNLTTGKVFDIEIDLLGDYQRKNVVTIMTAIDVLRTIPGINLPEDAVLKGLRNAARTTGLNGRWQVLIDKPYIVCDTAHNKAGLLEVVSQISRCKYKKLYIVLGVVNDKDLDSILPILPKEAYYFFTQATIERALDADILAKKAREYNLSGEVVRDVKSALSSARSLSSPDDMIYIGGSTFTVAEI